MRKKDIRQDTVATTPAVSPEPAIDAAAEVSKHQQQEPKLGAALVEPPTTQTPGLESTKAEVPIDLPMLAAAKHEAPAIEACKPEAPKFEAAKPETLKYDEPKFDPPKPDARRFDPLKSTAEFRAKETPKAVIQAEAARPRTNRFPLLAASVALAAAFGGLLGSLAMAGVAKFTAVAPVVAAPVAAAATTFVPATTTTTKTVTVSDPQWKEAIARVRSDIAALKAEVEASNRAISAHFSKIGDRFDRTERAQSDPTKIARIIETLDRIELRTAAAAAAAPPAAAPPTTPDTGSVAADGRPKPPVVDGWVLRQVFDGYALIEGFNGRLFEVGPGSNIPGIGRVETIRRHEGQWVVVTPKGVITR